METRAHRYMDVREPAESMYFGLGYAQFTVLSEFESAPHHGFPVRSATPLEDRTQYAAAQTNKINDLLRTSYLTSELVLLA